MSGRHYSTNGGIPIMVGNRVVGQVSDGRFIKRLRGSKHMLREPRAWGFDVESLEAAGLVGAAAVEVNDLESGTVYSAPLALVFHKGFLLDRGFGSQVALPLRFWSVHHTGETEQLALALA